MRIFILEDEIDQYPREQLKMLAVKHNLTVAKSCNEAIQKYKGPYDLLLLDHDMEGNYEYREDFPNTGYQFVKWLVENETDRPQVILHSQNSVGRKNMLHLLHDHGFSVDECQFGPAYVKQLKAQLL